MEEGEGGGNLKEARLQALGVGTELRQKREELLLGDRPSLDLDALPEVHQVGAGVEAHPKPRLLQDGGEGPGGGALPVRPPHEGHGIGLLGVAKAGEEGPDPLQARGKAALPGVEPGEGVHLALEGGLAGGAEPLEGHLGLPHLHPGVGLPGEGAEVGEVHLQVHDGPAGLTDQVVVGVEVGVVAGGLPALVMGTR